MIIVNLKHSVIIRGSKGVVVVDVYNLTKKLSLLRQIAIALRESVC